MKGTLSFMNTAYPLSRIEQDTCRSTDQELLHFTFYKYLFHNFLFTPKELFMRPIKQAFISLPTAWIDSEVARLLLDYSWRSSYFVCFALLCLRGCVFIISFINCLYHSYLPLHYSFVLRTALLGLWVSEKLIE